MKHTQIKGYLISTSKLDEFGLSTQSWTNSDDAGRGKYETMVFKDNGQWHDLWCDRSDDMEVAMKQHDIACKKVKDGDIHE